MQKLFELMDALKTATNDDISQTFFISGHRNIFETKIKFTYASIPEIFEEISKQMADHAWRV